MAKAAWTGWAGRTLGTGIFVAAVLAGCGGAAVDTTIPLDQTRQLNTSLSVAYQRTNDLLIHASQVSGEMAMLPAGIGPDDFDVAMFREVVSACFTQTLQPTGGAASAEVPRPVQAQAGEARAPLTRRGDVGRVRPCSPNRLLALETYLNVVDASLQSFLLERLLAADSLRVNLGDVLPAMFDDLERRAEEAGGEAARLRVQVEQRRALAQSTLTSEQDRQENEQRYNQALDELDSIDALVAQIRGEIRDARGLRRSLVDETVRNIAALGTTP